MVSNSMLLGAIVWSTINYITDVNNAMDVITQQQRKSYWLTNTPRAKYSMLPKYCMRRDAVFLCDPSFRNRCERYYRIATNRDRSADTNLQHMLDADIPVSFANRKIFHDVNSRPDADITYKPPQQSLRPSIKARNRLHRALR